MRRFNSIKKSRKKSKDIDEKIEYLNKELCKIGLHEIANSTTGLYQGSSTNPNEKYVEFTAKNCNGYPFGISGDANLGQESVGGAMIRADGVALSPPHPITGERTVAMTKGDLLQGMKPAIPGDKPTPQSRMTGPILWWFDPTYTFAGAQGRWNYMEYNSPAVHGNGVYPGFRAGWGYWGSNFIGTPMLRDDESYQHVFDCLNDSNGDQFNPDEITVPTTIVFFQNDLGDPTHLPIDVRRFGFSPEAFDWLKDKATDFYDAARNFGDKLDTAIEDAIDKGISLTQELSQELFNSAVQNLIPPNPNNHYTRDIAGSIADGEPRVYEGDDIPKEQKDKLIQNIFEYDIGTSYIPITSKPTNYSDDNFYVNDNGDVIAHSGDSKENYPPNTASHVDLSYDDNPFKNYGIGPGKYSDNPLAKAGQYHLELVVPPDGSEPYFNYEDHAYYNPNSADPDEVDKGVQQTLANISQAAGQQLPGYPDGIKGDVVKKFTVSLSDAIKVNPDIMRVPAIKKLIEDSAMFKESLDESVKLGHFEPEVLTVDINKLRKGIAPEFPKDPPAEMVGGYSAKSRLAPKIIKGEPFIKITKKDLALNHKITDKEISDFMNDINLINNYIKENPAQLKYAMIRYPKDDPRLAQLNFKMDQMKAASDQYMETHFPENKSLFNRLRQKISNTIGQTDPKNFKDHTPPPQFTDDLDTIKRRKQIIKRHFKKKKG